MRRIKSRFKRAAFLALSLISMAVSCFSHNSVPPPGVDTTGTPDLVARPDLLTAQWRVANEFIPANSCTAIESGITPGMRKLLRFTVGVSNIGDADLVIGDPQQHIDANDGLFEFSPCHNHYHFRKFALYELVDTGSGQVWRSTKRSFCMRDDEEVPAGIGPGPDRPRIFTVCGTVTKPGNQGISHGWTDIYDINLPEQFIVLDGGAGEPLVPPGNYTLRITVNPPFDEGPNDPCRALDSLTGKCHQFEESLYANNIGEITVAIP